MEKKVELVDNWQKLYKSWTMILSAVGAVANLIMGGLYLLTNVMDAKTFAYVNFGLYLLIGVARMIKQPSLSEPPKEPVGDEVHQG